MADRKEHSLQTLNLALSVADAAVRSDIECYAHRVVLPDGTDAYDPRFAQVSGAMSDAEIHQAIATAQRAAKYIDLRGDVFPWRMVRVDGATHLVRFIARDAAAADPEPAPATGQEWTAPAMPSLHFDCIGADFCRERAAAFWAWRHHPGRQGGLEEALNQLDECCVLLDCAARAAGHERR